MVKVIVLTVVIGLFSIVSAFIEKPEYCRNMEEYG